MTHFKIEHSFELNPSRLLLQILKIFTQIGTYTKVQALKHRQSRKQSDISKTKHPSKTTNTSSTLSSNPNATLTSIPTPTSVPAPTSTSHFVSTSPALLKAQNLFKAYSGKKIIQNVSFEVKSGEVVGLLGPNGAGKTTSFYSVVGITQPDSGDIYLGDQCITHLPMYQRARRGIGYLPQEASIFRRLTVEQNLLAVLETLPLKNPQRKTQLEQLLEEFQLEKIAKQKGYTLSGGERRRVEVARALALNPQFLLLDEPFAGVDPIAVGEIQKMIGHLKQRGIGILMTDHNVRETLAICDHGYLLNLGQILDHGTAEHLSNSELARKFYLGEQFSL